MGWKDDPVVGNPSAAIPAQVPAPNVEATPAWQADPVVKEAPSMLDKVGRQVGLTGRALASGAVALPALGADAIGAILNLGIDAYNKNQGTQIPRFQPQGQVVEKGLSAAGLPEPETPTERIVYRAGQALSGQGAVMGAGKALASASNPTVAGVGTVLSQNAAPQLQAAAGAGLAGGAAHEAGWGPLSEFLASLAGGVATPSIISAAKGIPGLIEPFTAGGQRSIAGNVLSSSASSPVAAIEAIRNGGSTIPGVTKTLAATTRDPGLASLERSLSAKPAGGVLQEQYLQNNAARMDELNNLAGSAKDITAAETARDTATSGLRQTALDSAKVGSPSDAVVANIDTTLKSPKGNREVVNQALSWAKDRIQGVTDPERLYEVRKDINDAMNGKLAGDKSGFKLASSELMKVRDQLDDVIESDAPGFKAYLQKYKDASKPINQLEVLQEIRNRVQGTGEDRLGNRQILPSNLQRTMDNLDDVAASATGFKKAKAEDILSSQQMDRLNSLRKDVADAAFSQSGGKVAGSNTVQLANYSTANIIGRIAGGEAGPITRNIGRGLDWLNKLNDRDIDRLLIEAAKDPALAGTLMKDASPDRVRLASDGLEQLARAIGIGSATASGQQKQRTGTGKPQ